MYNTHTVTSQRIHIIIYAFIMYIDKKVFEVTLLIL